MYKKFVSMICAVMIAGSAVCYSGISAAVIPPDKPAYSYTMECTAELSISGRKATCESYARGYYNITDKIIIYQYLQR